MTFQEHVDRIAAPKRHRRFLPLLLGVAVLIGVVVWTPSDGSIRPAAQTEVKSPVDLALQAVETAKQAYEQKGDLESFTAYGQALDQLTQVTQDCRSDLQARFFHQLAIEAGRKYNIHWSLLYAVWMRESKMDPTAKGDGKSDEQGVFIPGTWKAFGLGQVHLATAQTHYDRAITKEQLLNPITNGLVSAKVLRDYIDMFGGNTMWGVSSYQQGPAPAQYQFKNGQMPKNFQKYVQDVWRLQQEALQKWGG